MSKFPFLAVAATMFLTIGGSSNALADCDLVKGLGLIGAAQFQGYSTQPAKTFNSPGTSTVQNSMQPWDLRCITENPDGTTSIDFIRQYTISETKYTNGPGNSPFEKRNPGPTCVEAATGTIPCPF